MIAILTITCKPADSVGVGGHRNLCMYACVCVGGQVLGFPLDQAEPRANVRAAVDAFDPVDYASVLPACLRYS